MIITEYVEVPYGQAPASNDTSIATPPAADGFNYAHWGTATNPCLAQEVNCWESATCMNSYMIASSSAVYGSLVGQFPVGCDRAMAAVMVAQMNASFASPELNAMMMCYNMVEGYDYYECFSCVMLQEQCMADADCSAANDATGECVEKAKIDWPLGSDMTEDEFCVASLCAMTKGQNSLMMAYMSCGASMMGFEPSMCNNPVGGIIAGVGVGTFVFGALVAAFLCWFCKIRGSDSGMKSDQINVEANQQQKFVR